MTRTRAKALLPVIQAYAEGKSVQCKLADKNEAPWENIEPIEPSWDDALNYRVKPEPREWWLIKTGVCLCGDAPLGGYHAYLNPVYGENSVHVREVLDESKKP